jgi:hypothetical protein
LFLFCPVLDIVVHQVLIEATRSVTGHHQQVSTPGFWSWDRAAMVACAFSVAHEKFSSVCS